MGAASLALGQGSNPVDPALPFDTAAPQPPRQRTVSMVPDGCRRPFADCPQNARAAALAEGPPPYSR
jgi:hypothetical protein